MEKGTKHGNCNRSACQKPGATWYNHSTQAWYCLKCAGQINEANQVEALELFGHELCTFDIRPIITNTPENIHKLCKASEPFYNPAEEDLHEILTDLFETAHHHATTNKMGCAGLAANQIGELKQVFVMRYGNKFIAVVNPTVLKVCSKTTYAEEGCLSRPGQRRVGISRPKWIKAQYICPESGTLVTKKFHGFDARVFCHEMDHLRGVLI